MLDFNDNYFEDPNFLDYSIMIEIRIYNLKIRSGLIYSYYLQKLHKYIQERGFL